MIPRVIAVRYLGEYKLEITFAPMCSMQKSPENPPWTSAPAEPFERIDDLVVERQA